MLRNIHIAATLCFLAVSASLWAFATSSVAAKHRSVTSTGKQRSGTPTTKQKPDIPTPTNTNDCLAMSQALYGQAETLIIIGYEPLPRSRRKKTGTMLT
jgi:hypothetical protein